MRQSKKDVIAGSVLSLLAVFYLIFSFQIKRTNIDRVVGSRMFPQICGCLLLVLSVSLIVNGAQKMMEEKRTAKSQETDQTDNLAKPDYRKTAAVLTSFVLYIVLMGGIGFAPASVLYLFSQMILMGKKPFTKKKIVSYAVISIAASAAVFVLFNNVFLLMLPKAGWF